MNLPPRTVATPPAHKRKEREHFRSFKPPPPRLGSAHPAKSTLPPANPNLAKQTRVSHDSTPSSKPTTNTPQAAAKPDCNNLLLAGYMAHELLAKGSIMGQPIDPAPAAAKPIKRSSRDAKPSRVVEERYAEVASLLKTDGPHVTGVVNPTQLACYLNQ